MIEIGKANKLVVIRAENNGYVLKDLESSDQVYMPQNFATTHLQVDQEVTAFVYLDSQNEMTATTRMPYAMVGEYALMTVKEAHEFGAFFHWGIKKDLLVPGNQQKVKVRESEDHIVRVCIEEGTNRIYGTTKLGKYIESSEFDIDEGSKVEIVPVEKTQLGYRSIVNRKFIGMIYHSEIFQDLYMGQPYPGVVKKLRADGLVDLSLQPLGIRNSVSAKDTILEYLKENGGKSTLHDKSSPEDIKDALGMSKKTFKAAVGMLYKDRKIVLTDDGIELKS